MSPEDVPEDLVLTVNDIRKAGFCVQGQRRWFQSYGMDFREIMENGVLARTVLETGDAYAIRAVAKVMEVRDGRR